MSLKWKIILVVWIVGVTLVGCSNDNNDSNVTTSTTNSSQSEEVEEGYIRVTVSRDNGSQYITEEQIQIEEGKNLLDLMKTKFFIEQSSGDITSIERVKASEDENTAWEYTVNGKEMDVLPIDYIPNSGDKIVFDLKKDTNEHKEEQNVNEDLELDYRVLQTVPDHSSVIYAAVPDDQFQYVIPISFVVSDELDLNEAYNNLEQYLKDQKLIDQDYLLHGLTYNIQENQVQIQLPEGFSVSSSAQAYMFEKLLAAMFLPIGIDKVTFHPADGERLELGPYGEIDELLLNHEKSSYKIYRDSNFVMIPNDELTIEEAILQLKEDQNEFNVHHTIPEDVAFTVESQDNKLILTYEGPLDFNDLQDAVIMIESILMTAKAYGYEFVSLEKMPFEKVGSLDVTKDLKVPVAVNPIVIK